MDVLPESVVLIGGLASSARGPVIQRSSDITPVFTRQGELPGGPGSHCIVMALLALGEISRADVSAYHAGARGYLAGRTWSWLARDYLVGADTPDLRSLATFVSGNLRCSFTFAKGSRGIRWISRYLSDGCFVVVGIESKANFLDHWALAVGQAQARDGATCLLLLDPCSSAPTERCWNGVLRLPSGSQSPIYRDENSKRMRVTVSGAVAISRAQCALERVS